MPTPLRRDEELSEDQEVAVDDEDEDSLAGTEEDDMEDGEDENTLPEDQDDQDGDEDAAVTPQAEEETSNGAPEEIEAPVADENDEDEEEEAEAPPKPKREKGKKRKARGDSERKKGKKKKKKKAMSDSAEDSDSKSAGAASDNDSDFVAERSKPKKPKVEKGQKSSAEICAEFNLEDVVLDYTDEDYETLTNYKLFSQHIRPIIAKANPKIAISKMVTLISAKWREFLENNPNREAILDEEDRVVVPKPKPKEDFEKAPSKPKKSKSRKSVPMLKIKIGSFGKRKKHSSEEDESYSDKSDADFEAALEEAQNMSPPPAKKKSKTKKTKKKKKTKTTASFPGSEGENDGYETDHQDYCEVCQQGGEIILCDTCPRAYHLVCLDPDLEEPPEGKWSCPHCEGAVTKEVAIKKKVEDEIKVEPLKAKVAKILTWRWYEVPKSEDVKKEENDKEEPSTSSKPQAKPQREFFVKWHDLSYWHCSWISEAQLEYFHPSLFRCYCRKNDMEEPPALDDGSSGMEVGKDGKTKYLVKWRDLPYDFTTWEEGQITDDFEIPDWQKAESYYWDLRAALESQNKKYVKSKSTKGKRPKDLRDEDGTRRLTPPPDKPTVDPKRKI
ncbi:chromodomain-helicase-DNA-binding protein 5 [Caerostris extrusa]|uniref:Chromodomain-helicase-DNA-binding protein 5 n=1 Tax=Caerostris extrusa TaxID=172846 RepID=A0AAV4XY28_CAEEX|nr:chromodomain-helicase-DNA-binding protein 5 [Caerostris extrusa]